MADTPTLVVVTAGSSAARLERFSEILRMNARDPQHPPPVVAVLQAERNSVLLHSGLLARTAEYMGVVPAFAYGAHLALTAYPNTEVIACLHDDCLLLEAGWDSKIVEHFNQYLNCGLAGFGGAWGLGDEQAGQGEYRPTWLVRRGFMSNMRGAEMHGTRVRTNRQVAVLDGFSLIFRRSFLAGHHVYASEEHPERHWIGREPSSLFAVLQRWGVMHHAYDAAMGAFAKELGWDTWLLAYECEHLGGQTAVGDANYQEWAKQQRPDPGTNHPHGDQAFWTEAHRIVWNKLGHLLPFEVNQP